jgi:hypothetical protein
MNDSNHSISRRKLLTCAAAALTGAGIATIMVRPAMAQGKGDRSAWFYQDTPNTDGKMCRICVNFTAKDAGTYGADSGECALIEKDISGHGYCLAWTVNPVYGGGRSE